MLGIDLMAEALEVARHNAALHGVSDRIHWLCGDLFCSLKDGFQADAILSNPPYVPSELLRELPPEVHWEPRVSLEGGEGGLSFYSRMAEASPFTLKEGGFLFLEIGENQAAPVRDLFCRKGPFACLEIRKDFSGTPRIMIFRKGRDG